MFNPHGRCQWLFTSLRTVPSPQQGGEYLRLCYMTLTPRPELIRPEYVPHPKFSQSESYSMVFKM